MTRPSEEIKDKLDIVDFIKGYLDLKPAGKNFKALCPFHQEKTPSFVVSPERQIWHCFGGCGDGGDIFKFLMRYENLEFYEALRVLAEKAGVELKRLNPAEERQFGVLYEINNAASEFFEKTLTNYKKGEEYLKKRGLENETIQSFAIGYAPKSSDELTLNLINRGFAVVDIVRAGFALKTERGQYIDRFRGRIMFPIHNHFGKIVGFSGRILPLFEKEGVGKYINSPDTPIFNKSRLLYGFWQSKRPIMEEQQVLLVEGQMDFLLAWQDGVRNVVATSGTALTIDHLRVLRRFTNKLILAFDADEAGHKASERSIDISGAQDFNVYLLSLGGYKDPAQAVVEKPGFLKDAMGSAKTAMEYYIERYLTDEASFDIQKKKIAVRAVLMKIKELWSPIEKIHWIGEVAYRVNIPEKELIEEMEKLNSGSVEYKERDVKREEEKRELGRHEVVAERVLSFVFAYERFKGDLEASVGYMPSDYIQVYRVIVKGDEVTPQVKSVVDSISLRAGFLFDDFPEEKLDTEMRNLLRELSLEYLKKERVRIGSVVQVAERSGDDDLLALRLKEFDAVLRKMQDIEYASEENKEKN